MTARRPWAALSPAYRRRLERGGVTPRSYAAGASLQAARGHEATPERPERAQRNLTRYARYLRATTPAMHVTTTHGDRLLVIPDELERSAVGTHNNAIRNMFAGNDIFRPFGMAGGSNLARFTGRTVHAYEPGSDELQTWELLTDRDELEARWAVGELRYEQIYAQTR